jgi:hypothetical protein
MFDPYGIQDRVTGRATRALTRIIYERLEGSYDPDEGPTPKQVEDAIDGLIDDVLGAFKARLRDHV